MKRRILSIITALALCLSLCPTWAFATEADPSLCKHHPEHTEDCGYAAPTEGHDCGHEHTEDCFTADEAGGKVLDCHHSHDSECGYVQADPGTPCGYECRICPIEDLIAALPEQVTADNAADVRARLDHILDLYRELNEDEQEEINLSRIYALQGALDAANDPDTIEGEVSVDYQEASWNSGVTYTTQTAASCTPVADSTDAVTWDAGWYVVNSTVTISEPITVTGAVNLILADGCTLNAKKGIVVTTGNSLTIYAQSGGTGTLNATGTADSSNNASAGIGGSTSSFDSGAITIHGGVINATGGSAGSISYGGAGIGGGTPGYGNGGSSGAITIYGGTVTANSGAGDVTGAGIGGGGGLTGGGTGSNIQIYGGTINATGSEGGAGIGGGGSGAIDDSSQKSGDGAVTISGGIVTAVGGTNAAGIGGGGGYYSSYTWGGTTYGSGCTGGTGSVTITGGIVDAKGGAGNSSGDYAGAPIGNGGNTTATATVSKTNAIVFENGAGTVCGDVTLDGSYTVPGDYTLNIPVGASLSGSGTLSGGSAFTTENLTEDMISVPEDWYYTGEDRTADIETKLSGELDKGITICGQTFTVSGWTLAVEKAADSDLTYTATYTNNSDNAKTVQKTITLLQSGTDLTDGKVKTYKDGAECSDFTAGDTITVKATPTPTGDAPQKAAARLRGEPGTGQMALYVGDALVSSEAANADTDGSYTMTVSAADVLLAAGGPKTGITLTARFTANDNMADGAGTATVNITAAAKAERDGNVIDYFGVSDFEGTNNLFCQNDYANATITLLEDVQPGTNSDAGTTCSAMVNITCTLDLAGHNFTSTDTAIYVLPMGNLTIQDSSTGKTGNVSFIKSDGTLTLYGGTFGKIETAYTLSSLLAKNCAYYRGSTPILLSELEGQKTLDGTVTVQECRHKDVTPTSNNDGTHTLSCPYCGYTKTAEDCDYGEYTHNDTSHTRICKLCGYQNVEVHNIKCTTEASGTVIAVSEACKTCGYGKDLGTVTIHIPKLVYGDLTGVVTAENTLTEPVAVAGNVKNPLGETIIFSDHVIIDPPTMATLTGNALLSAGEHKIKINIVIIRDENALAECELTFNVDPAPLPEVTLSAESATYSGTEQKPALSVQQGETALTEGTDYEVSYTRDGVVTNDFTSAGTVNITVTGKGNYTGSVEKTYTIGKATPTIAWNPTDVETIYTGQPANVKPVVTLVNGETYTGEIHYSWYGVADSLVPPTDAKTYGNIKASIPEQDNYNAAITQIGLNLHIDYADQAAPAAPTAEDANIKDTSITLTAIENAEYKMGDGEWQESPTFTGLEPNQAYTFYARLKADRNHNASLSSTGTSITTRKAMLENASVTITGTYTYTGAVIVPEAGNVEVVLNGTKIDSDQYTISASNNIDAGVGKATLTVTATETGDYSGSVSSTFTISPATPALAWSSTTQELAYTGSAATITAPTVTLVGSDTFSGTITYSHAAQGGTEFKDGLPTNAGTYTVKASIAAQGNYTAAESTNTLALTIKPSPVTLTFNNQTITYGGTPTGATASPASAEIKYSYTTEADGTPISGWPTNAGTYTVTAKVEATGNYGGASQTATLTINPKEVSNPTIELSPSSFDYDGTAKKPAVTVKDGTTVIPASEYTVAYSNNINAGTATVTITNVAGNYTVSGTTTFAITAKPLTGAKVEATGTFTYTGSAQEPTPTVTLGGKTLTENTDYTVAYASNTNAGTAKITVTGMGNYSGTAQGTFAIGRADLTADGTGIASGTYGDKLSGLTVSGLTAKLGEATVTGTWKLTGDTVPNVGDSGEYTATFTPATGADNYNALTAQVKLNIAKADYSGTTTASTSAKFGTTGTYDLSALLPDGATAGTATTTSDIFEGTPEASGKTLTYTLKAGATVGNTGTITVPVTSTNYNDFNLTITVTVTNKDVPTLTVSPITVTYTGEAVPASAIKGEAKVGSTTVPGTWAFASGEAVTNVADSGTKAVKFVPTDKDTYAETTGTVVVTITKATPSLSLTPSPATLPNGGTVTLTLSGLPGGSATVTCSDTSITVAKGSGNTWTADLPAGGASYAFTASYAGDGNHNGATASCTVSVEKITPRLSLTAAPAALRGGGAVTLTLSGLPAGGTATVSCSSGITVTAGAGSTWTATLPNSTATYTFTASYAGSASYNAASASCTVETSEVTVLPNPPAAEDGKQYQVVMEDGISEVPAGLQSIETLNTPEKLETAMKTAITQANSGVPQDNTAVYDVELQISTDGGATWTKATAANFPANGLTVTLPYPAGTNSSYTFTVVHMFTTSDFDKTPGDTETPRVTNTASGLQFTVSGLSPISVGWEQPKTPVTPPTPSGGGGGGGGGWSSSTYAVTVERAEHGKVTSNRTNASSGSTVTLTATPDSGYVLDTLTVTDSRGNEIRLTAQGGGKYTFTMPSRAVTVKAAFAPLPDDTEKPCDGGVDCPSHGFTDLGTVGTWYHEAVDYVLRNNLMGGYGNGLFGPNDTLTRAQFAQILYNKEGRPAVMGSNSFSDVAPGAWCAPAITWAAERGIVGGYGNGMFGPNDNITREQLAVMLWRYAGSPAATDKELHFNDADKASGYAVDALRWAVENGIINGKGGGILDPKGLATRAQTAQMLKNFLKDE